MPHNMENCINCRFWCDQDSYYNNPDEIGEPEILVTIGMCQIKSKYTTEFDGCENFERPESAAD